VVKKQEEKVGVWYYTEDSGAFYREIW